MSNRSGACGGNDETEPATKESGGGQKQDLEIVQYALTLEHLETDFYNAVIDSGVVKDPKLGEVAKAIRDNEQAHVDALTATVKQLGGKPEKPQTTFDAVIDGGMQKVLETARRSFPTAPSQSRPPWGRSCRRSSRSSRRKGDPNG